MECVICGREKDPCERGWVTVLAEVRAYRIHYCPECMENLVNDTTPDAAEDQRER